MRNLNDYTGKVIEGEFNRKTSYLSWEVEPKDGDLWAQGEFERVVYKGKEVIRHDVTDDEGDHLYTVIAY